MILSYSELADWVMLCTPRTASTSLSMMLGLRNKPDGSGGFESDSEACGRYFGHVPASRLAERFGLARWRRTFSFGFVRNPWDRMVSICARINPQRLETTDSFTAWLYEGCPNSAGAPHAAAGGVLIHQPCSDFVFPCTYVGRYETFNDDVVRICSILGKEVPESIQYECRPRSKPYQEYYTQASRNWVSKHCWQDIMNFGYRFED